MTYIAKPKLHHPSLVPNRVGYTRRDYEGKISTLCAGCGHDSISAAIIQACWELDIEPHRVAKLSGIGCSSKTPDYFLGASHGFNTVHGRMPSVLTGANLANRDLLYLGVSGDGDSASIGFGQFAHFGVVHFAQNFAVAGNIVVQLFHLAELHDDCFQLAMLPGDFGVPRLIADDLVVSHLLIQVFVGFFDGFEFFKHRFRSWVSDVGCWLKAKPGIQHLGAGFCCLRFEFQ